jgi:acyl dehydratase
MSAPAQLYADDLTVGLRFRGEDKPLTQERFMQFAAMTGDAHPIHYDSAYAAAHSKFGKPIAHGLLLTSLTALGATKMSERIVDAMVAMVEQRWRFLSPAFVGDTVSAEYEVLSNQPTASGKTARVEIGVRLLNQAGVCVLEGAHVYLIRRRPAE